MNKRQRKKQCKKELNKRTDHLEISWNKGVHFRNEAIHFPKAVYIAECELLYIYKEVKNLNKEGLEMKKNGGKKKEKK